VVVAAGERRRIAIACQGGGSHTAFTAGVLKRLLGDDDARRRFEVVGLSGTSGGAICALLAWYGLADEDIGRPGQLLEAFWRDNSATARHEQLLNTSILWAGALQDVVAMPVVSPYDNPFAATASAELRRLIIRHVDFDAPPRAPEHPMLLVGAADVLSGQFRAFDSRRDHISVETILASAAIPTLFRSVHVEGGVYWDGLFSQNPPVRELVDARPDEIWVIQINPTRLDTEPRSALEIADRRNELAGNLSLHQELHFIEKVDQLLEEGALASGGRFRRIVVRIVELARSQLSDGLGPVSKLNRDPAFVAGLIAHGEARAGEFLTALAFESAWMARDVDATVAFLSDDALLESAAPFPAHGPARGRASAERFLRDHLADGADIDVTRKQVAAERVTWSARWQPRDASAAVRGTIDAEFDGGRVVSLRLTAAP
jgi:NTE family protein